MHYGDDDDLTSRGSARGDDDELVGPRRGGAFRPLDEGDDDLVGRRRGGQGARGGARRSILDDEDQGARPPRRVPRGPARGGEERERASLLRRGRPELTLCLALVHHLAITHNVPLPEIVAWLAELGAPLVVEFPTREDPMVQRLLAGKRAGSHGDYTREEFERRLSEAFALERHEETPSGHRILYEARPRAA